MLYLKDRTLEPQGGWTYRDPDLGVRLKAGTFNSLVQSVRSLRSVNTLAIPQNISEIIEDDICRNTARSFVKNPDEAYLGMVTRQDLLDAVNALPRGLTDDAPLAIAAFSQGCCSCPFNVPTVCLTCDGLMDHFKEKFIHLSVSAPAALHVCQIDCLPGAIATVCGPEKIKGYAVPRQPYPDHCWKKGNNP
jgi:hypothetical protein